MSQHLTHCVCTDNTLDYHTIPYHQIRLVVFAYWLVQKQQIPFIYVFLAKPKKQNEQLRSATMEKKCKKKTNKKQKTRQVKKIVKFW